MSDTPDWMLRHEVDDNRRFVEGEKRTDERFTAVSDAMDSHFDATAGLLKKIDEKTDSIHTQVQKTNGRVTELEKEKIRDEAKHDAYAKAIGELSPASMWTQRLLWGCTFAFPLLTLWAAWLTNETLGSQRELSPLQQAAITHAVDEAFKNNSD